MKITGIYKIQSRKKPQRYYIGSALNISRRWHEHKTHLKQGNHHSLKLQRHYNKYGKSDLEFSVLLGCNKSDLINNEQYFIDILNPWFNICRGAKSCLGRVLSEETKKKISKSHKGIVNSPESIEKIRQANLGRKNPHTAEWNKKISESQKGRELTEDHKRKLSLAKRGKDPWNKGKKTGQIVWNKGKKGLQTNPRKGKKKINGVYVFVNVP